MLEDPDNYPYLSYSKQASYDISHSFVAPSTYNIHAITAKNIRQQKAWEYNRGGWEEQLGQAVLGWTLIVDTFDTVRQESQYKMD